MIFYRLLWRALLSPPAALGRPLAPLPPPSAAPAAPQAIAHEGLRVFRDRLVGDHQEQFQAMLFSTLQSLVGFKPDATVWYSSTLGASAEERISGDLSKIKMLRWEADTFAELVAEKLKVRAGAGRGRGRDSPQS